MAGLTLQKIWLTYIYNQNIVPQISCVEGVTAPKEVVSSGRLTHFPLKFGTRVENHQK
jgi:hypothetical protein